GKIPGPALIPTTLCGQARCLTHSKTHESRRPSSPTSTAILINVADFDLWQFSDVTVAKFISRIEIVGQRTLQNNYPRSFDWFPVCYQSPESCGECDRQCGYNLGTPQETMRRKQENTSYFINVMQDKLQSQTQPRLQGLDI
ncbi:hypothetical protein BDR04DRAFT_232180, partial [Suillus decipiens]